MDADSDKPQITNKFEDDVEIVESREILKFYADNKLVKNAVFRFQEFILNVNKIQRNIDDIRQQKILYNQLPLKQHVDNAL